MDLTTNYLHRFSKAVSDIQKPSKFNFPFSYEPHALSLVAAEQVQSYLENQQDFDHNFGIKEGQTGLIIGKMFGVLVVEDQQGKLGFLAACSGKLAGTNQHRYFVPPIFDMLNPYGFFLEEENHINQLNRKIERLQEAAEIQIIKQQLDQLKAANLLLLSDLRALHKANKIERKSLRASQKDQLDPQVYQEMAEDLIKQSYRDQHDYDVAKRNCQSEEALLSQVYQSFQDQIDQLKNERKQRSSTLQGKLFDQYQFLNARGESRSVLTIFEEAIQLQPPAGAGECAAPKLLQFAYQQNLSPICMAEFWWGASPNTEVRKHQFYYPACRGKCEPILNHMLQGLEVEDNPMLQNPASGKELEIIYEDDAIIVVNKPAEFLSVPGIHIQDSVQTRIAKRNPEITGPMIIHRLDMSTSGILVLAKNKEAHQIIQDQFIKHTVQKRYSALLAGELQTLEGKIELPLRVDLDDRPRQVVCYTYGKPAETLYKVVEVKDGKTKVHFFPLTGRTHQLRVHAAHSLGLNTAIVGDDLYGVKADRLHLHAGNIAFIHPVSKQPISFSVEDPF